MAVFRKLTKVQLSQLKARGATVSEPITNERYGAPCETAQSEGKSHVIIVPNWMPTPLNQLLVMHWGKRSRAKVADYSMVRLHSRGVPRAVSKRRVDVTVTLPPRRRATDPDSVLKVLLDALASARLLVNDSHRWCEFTTPIFVRGTSLSTSITLTDIG